jgi:hypothetical protein
MQVEKLSGDTTDIARHRLDVHANFHESFKSNRVIMLVNNKKSCRKQSGAFGAGMVTRMVGFIL